MRLSRVRKINSCVVQGARAEAAVENVAVLVDKTKICSQYANVAQLVEHAHGKGEVAGSIPANGSKIYS